MKVPNRSVTGITYGSNAKRREYSVESVTMCPYEGGSHESHRRDGKNLLQKYFVSHRFFARFRKRPELCGINCAQIWFQGICDACRFFQ